MNILHTLTPVRHADTQSKKKDQFDLHFHVAVIGDVGVGKSTIIDTECKGASESSAESGEANKNLSPFHQDFEYAASGFKGIKFRSRTYHHSLSLDHAQFGPPKIHALDTRVKVTYWDVPGNEDWVELSSHLCSGVAAVMYVFDVNNPSTFEDLKVWIAEIEQSKPLIKIIVGNKADLDAKVGRVSMRKGNHFAERMGTFYYEISAMISASASHTFHLIRSEVLSKLNGQSINRLRKNALETRVKLGQDLLGSENLILGKVYTPLLPDTTDECDWL